MKRSDVVSRKRVETHNLWMKLESLVDVLEDNLPIIEEALAEADRPTRSCVDRVRKSLERIKNDD